MAAIRHAVRPHSREVLLPRRHFSVARRYAAAGVLAWTWLSGFRVEAEPAAATALPDQARIQAGLVVHAGCGDGRITAALRTTGNVIVHGLDTDPANVRAARERMLALGLSGPIAIDLQQSWDRLPYADNLVNLLVCHRPEVAQRLSDREVLRVLAPRGQAWLRRNGKWVRIRKSPPDDIDEWTHYMHDPSGNPVAHDRRVAPPRRVQWIQPPLHTRSHEHTPSLQALVSANGRLFYVEDDGPTENVAAPAQWRLIARDAFNGLLLWRRPIPVWFPVLVNWGQLPPFFHRRLVAVGDDVYVTLGFHAPVSRLDAATGDVRRVYEGTEGTQEIVVANDVLLITVVPPTPEKTAELKQFLALERQPDSPLFKRETALPFVRKFMQAEFWKGKREIRALDIDTGRTLWRKAGAETNRLRYLSLRVLGDRVLYQNGAQIVCMELRSGKHIWSVRAPKLWTASDACIICADKKNVCALSVKDGSTLWTQPLLIPFIRDVFIIGDSVWIGGFKPFDTGRKYTGPVWGPYFATQRDLRTGKVLKHITPENPGHHHRCWLNKATDRYIVAGRRGAEFIDLNKGEVFWNNWVRGVCRYGTLPCNGMLYAPPHACGCYIAAKLDGFWALTGEGALSVPESPSIERGSGAGASPAAADSAISPEDWPTYRHDAGRSGAASCAAPPALNVLWETAVGTRLTPLVAAGGRVFVADRERYVLAALDAESGKTIWRYIAAARIDSPPAVYQNRVIFGVRDGTVVCLRARDGALVWRLRLHPSRERLIAADGRIESAKPVFGSVLLHKGSLYFTDGRSSYVDGGITLWRVAPDSGRVLSRRVVYSPDPKTGEQPPQFR